MMTDEELNILMQSLSDEEIGGLYASLPETDDEEAAGRIADRFYQKCAAAGITAGRSVRRTVKQRPKIPLKYMGFAAAACVAVAAGAVAFYNAQTEKPGVIIQPASSNTAVVTEITVSHTTTASETVSGSTGSETGTAQTTAVTADTTDSAPAVTESGQSAVYTEPVTTATSTEAASTGTMLVTSVSGTATAAVTSGTATTGATVSKPFSTSTTTTTTTTGALKTTITSTTAVNRTDPLFHTSISTYTEETFASRPPMLTSSTVTSGVVATSAWYYTTDVMESTVDYTYETSAVAPYEGRDHASAWLVHAPYCNTYQRGEWYDLDGTVLGVEYHTGNQNELEYDNYVVLNEHPEMFTIDDSEYDADRPGTYPIHIIYDRGEALGSWNPAEPAVVSIYVTVL